MRYVLAPLVLAVAAALTLGAYAWSLPVPEREKLIETDFNVKRGAYIARVSGCVSCHTDDENGGRPLAGGVALSTKVGTFYTPNITPGPAGVGTWSLEDFARAVRHGTSPDGEPYYPAFPYSFYEALNDRDIADLWAAIQIVPADPTPSKAHDLSFPYSLRIGVKLWRALFPSSPYERNVEKSASWNRGKLIAQGFAHCGACHTPRNVAGARIVEKAYAGDPHMLDGGSSPPISPQALKAEGWTKGDIVRALTTGVMPNGDVFGGTMAEVVRDNTAYLLPVHLDDLATYLLDEG